MFNNQKHNEDINRPKNKYKKSSATSGIFYDAKIFLQFNQSEVKKTE